MTRLFVGMRLRRCGKKILYVGRNVLSVTKSKAVTEASQVLHFVKKIGDQLFSKEGGGAAVMVGAGFSFNARRVSPTAPPFLTWGQLVDVLYRDLYPYTNDLTDTQRKPTGGSALALAQEYEAAFGRAALEDRIQQSLPDTSYEPGELHQKLLDLPWADVFTTNYDTLIERTRPAIYDRKYEVVLTPKDIASRAQPRIVKLNGSFPSTRPYVVTEEDFRTYSQQFSPFVNFVQQSLMENIFVLLGFSGDDPNFQFWTGWVRDHFGKRAPPIYLCGLFNFSSSERALFESKNTRVVDLSALFPESKWPNKNERHTASLRWLLANLRRCQPPKVDAWPEADRDAEEVPDLGAAYPPMLRPPPTLTEQDPPFIFSEEISRDLLLKVMENWRAIRREHPGWLVTPYKNRETLRHYTDSFRHLLAEENLLKHLSPAVAILLLHEINWRVETLLMPLFINEANFIATLLEKVNPFPDSLDLPEAEVSLDTADTDIPWDDLREAWVALAFAIAQEAREDLDIARFEQWMDRLKLVIPRSPDQQARWHHERCLMALFRLDERGVRESLRSWQLDVNQPVWMLRRAGILAELSALDDSESLAAQALDIVRRQTGEDYPLLSLESWLIFFLQNVRFAQRTSQGSLARERDRAEGERLEKLRAYRCDPEGEREYLRLKLKAPIPLDQPPRTYHRDFDTGGTQVTYHAGYEPSALKSTPAFSLLRLLEWVGIPAKIPPATIFSAAPTAAKWIYHFAPYWSTVALIRSGLKDKNELNDWFSRLRIASLSKEDVATLAPILLDSLEQAIVSLGSGNINHGSFYFYIFNNLAEVVSRLTIRFDEVQLFRATELALRAYQSPFMQQRFFQWDGVDALLERTLRNLEGDSLSKLLTRLVSLPLPDESGTQVDMQTVTRWPEPFSYIPRSTALHLELVDERARFDATIGVLLEHVRRGRYELRSRAAIRLEKLSEMRGLTKEQLDAFVDTLWSQVDDKTGLPKNTRFYPTYFLTLPKPISTRAKEALRSYIMGQDFPILFEIKEGGDVSYSSPPRGETLTQAWMNAARTVFDDVDEKYDFIDWSEQEAKLLLAKLIHWWDQEGHLVKRHLGGMVDVLRGRIDEVAYILRRVILPRLKDVDHQTKELGLKLAGELRNLNIPLQSLSPATLFLDASVESVERVADELFAAINETPEASPGEKRTPVASALVGIYEWIIYGVGGDLPELPERLLSSLVDLVLTRREPGLVESLDALSWIVKSGASKPLTKHFDKLLHGLQFLLHDTEVPEKESLIQEDRYRTVSLEDVIVVRKAAAKLAAELLRHYRETHQDVPQILLDWKKEATTSVLPELRAIFR